MRSELLFFLAIPGIVFLYVLYRIFKKNTLKKTAELAESKSRFRGTFEQAAVGIAHVSLEGRFLRVNRKLCEIVGYSEDEILDLSFQDITHADDLDADLEHLHQVLNGEIETYSMDKRYYRKDGSIVWINLTVALVLEGSTPDYYVSVIQDVSKRKQAEDNLTKSEAKYRELVDNSIVGVFNSTPDGQFLFVNNALAQIFDFDSPEQMIAEGSLPRWADSKQREQLISNLRQYGSVKSFEAETITHAGRELTVLVSVKLQGDIISGMVMDITERKQIEKKLKESHEFTSHILSSIPEAIFSVKVPERTIEWVHDSYGIFGSGESLDHLKGRPTKDFFVSDKQYEKYGELRKKAMLEGKSWIRSEINVRREDGTIFPAEVTGTLFYESGVVTKTTALVRDITDRKRYENKVLEYQSRLKELASQLTLAEENERRNIAIDLHDNVGQNLAISRIQLASAIQGCNDTHQKKQLEDVSATLLKAIQDTRQLIFEISSPSLHEYGLGVAVSEWVREKIAQGQGLDFTLVDNLAVDELDQEQRIILFRNLRELLTNTIKHARAKKVKVSLEDLDGQLKITVQDDGIGFNIEQYLEQPNIKLGFGLFSVEERMARLGGKLKIDSMPGQGCQIIMLLPHNVQARGSL